MTFTLLDGTIVGSDEVRLNPSNYHVYWDSGAGGQIDITNLMTRQQKYQAFAHFDEKIDNLRIYNEGLGTKTSPLTGRVGPIDPLTTNVTGIFTRQIFTDPLAAPADAATKVMGAAVSGTQIGFAIAAAGILIWLYATAKNR